MSAADRGEAPAVTVLLPVHDGEAFVAEAVSSILAQTFRDFELLVIDDDSQDRSAEIVAGFDDPRIRLVRNEGRMELIRTLNRGLDLARGKYVARMDADDVSLPQRLAQQVAFLDANAAVGACGSWVQTLCDGGGNVWRFPESSEDIRCRLLFDAALAHPSVCLRRAAFEAAGLRYDESARHAEDYDLWARASDAFPLANLACVLLRYRVHGGSVSQRHRAEQSATVARIQRGRLANLGLAPSDAELAAHRFVASGPVADAGPDAAPALAEIGRWLETLLHANRAKTALPARAFERMLGRFWLESAYRNLAAGRPTLATFGDSPLARCVPVADRVRIVAHAARRSLAD